MKNARKIVLLAVAMILSVGVANAELRFGVRAGLNVNKLKFSKEIKNTLTDPDNSCGWNAGVYAEYTVPVIGLGLDASLLYSRMNNGTSEKLDLPSLSEFDNDIETASYGRNFLEIPINVKYKFTLPVVSSFLKPYLFTGPSFAFKLDKNTISALKTRTCQVAWNVGLGIELVKHLQVQACYGFGINNIATDWVLDQAHITNENIKLRNNYWTVGVGYLF